MNSKILLLFTIVCLCGLFLTEAQNVGFTLEQRVPASTLFYASFPHLNQAKEALAKTQLAQLCQEPEVREFFVSLVKPYETQIAQALEQVNAALGMPVEKMLPTLYGELAVAVVDIDSQNPMMPLGLVLSWQFGEDRAPVYEILRTIQNKTGMSWEEQEKAGHQLFLLNGPPICFAFVGDVFIIATKPELLLRILEKNEATNSLQQHPAWQKAKAKVQKNHTPVAFAYVNLQQFLHTQFAGQIPPAAEPVLASLGLFDVKSLTLALNVHGDYLHNALFIEMQGERRGLTRFFYGDPCTSDMSKEIPKEAVGYTAGRFNLAWLLDEVENSIKMISQIIDQGGMLLGLYQHLWEKLETRLGFSIRNDLAATFGNEAYSFQYMPPDGGLIPYTVGVMTLKDHALFHKWLEPFAKNFALDIKKVTYQGVEIHYFSATLGQLGSNPFGSMDGKDQTESFMQSLSCGFSGMAFFIEGNRFYYSSSMHDLKNFLDMRSTWKEHLSDATDFQKVMQNLPANSSFVVYQDWRALWSCWYNTLTPFLRAFDGIMRKAGIPFDSALLPQSSTVRRHLAPTALSYLSDEDGILVQAYTVTGGLVYAVPGSILIGAVAIPAMEKEKQRKLIQTNEATAIGMLHNLATAQTQFQSSCIVDQDEDKIGEYGFLQELAGIINPRGKTEPVQPSYVAPSFVESINSGVILSEGYYFYCYLPGASNAIGEAEGMNNIASDAADNQETRYIIYAWPVEYGKTGNRTFAVNQSGEVHVSWESGYTMDNKPNAQDAFVSGNEKAANLEGDLAKDETAYVGYWQLESADEGE
jgi:hypothetical protein